MQHSRVPAWHLPLPADWFPVPFQRSPDGLPILRRRFHNYFCHLLLDEPFGQEPQMLGIAPKPAPLKLILTSDFDIRHDHSQHLFMDVNSRYPVHESSSRERRACHKLPSTRVTGYRRSRKGWDNAQLFAQSRTLRIRQYNSLDFSTEVSTSPLRALLVLP